MEPMNDDFQVNANIYEAQINAENNRLMGLQCEQPCSDMHCEHDKTDSSSNERMRSITFGSERELEYSTKDKSNNARTETIRMSKDFDGNRSGKSALKR